MQNLLSDQIKTKLQHVRAHACMHLAMNTRVHVCVCVCNVPVSVDMTPKRLHFIVFE